MKRALSILSLIMALCILLSCTAVTAYAEGESMDPEELGITSYYSTGNQLIVPGLPKLIRGSLEYDESKAEIYREHPKYGEDGVRFPLSEEYGELYDVDYRFEGTLLYFEYTVKNGVTLDDYLDALDAMRSEDMKVSREPGKKHNFSLVDVALKLKEYSMIGVAWTLITDVILDDGTVLYENGNRTGDGYGYQGGLLFPLAFPSQEQSGATPTEAPIDPYRDKLKRRYGITDNFLIDYELLYEHKDANDKVDWALIKGAESGAVSGKWSEPAYYEFGNRVMTVDYAKRPFAFGMGVYIAKYDRFFDVNAPEFKEMDGLERIWTELGAGRLMGDMDDNNRLEIIDALLIRRCQAGLTDYPTEDYNSPPEWEERAVGYFSDFDQDGERTVMDATCIQRYLANMPYRTAEWTPYPHNAWPEPEPPTEEQPTESVPTEPQPPESDDPIPRITGFRSIGKGVEISLSRVKGAEKYRVYYWSNANNTWKSMGETTGSTFIDDDVAVSSTYLYTVRCIKADLSAFTSDFYHPGWTYTYDPHLDTPQITDMEAVVNGVKITWNAVDGADLYRVYYCRDLISSDWKRLADVSETSYRHTEAQSGNNYYYTVRCLSCKSKSFASDFQPSDQFRYRNNPVITSITPRADSMEIKVDKNDNGCRILLYRKESSGWQRIGDSGSTGGDYTFYDNDVEVGKTYTYTARLLSADGRFFTSWYYSGKSKKYSVENYIPEFEFIIYTGDDMMLVQAKENIFGLDRYQLDIYDHSIDGWATVILDSRPHYIRYDNIKQLKRLDLYLTGIDQDGNVLSAVDESGYDAIMLPAPDSLKVIKLRDRVYRFSWQNPMHSCNLNLISDDGQYVIDSDLINQYGHPRYDIDLSDYPEDVQWNCIVWSCTKDGICCSTPISMEFSEADYQ